MRVLHIISSGGMYGAEAVILNLSHLLHEAGHASMLGVFANSQNPNLQLHEAALQKGVESHIIVCDGQIDPGVTEKIRVLARETSADVIQTHGYKADIYAYFSLRRSTIPIVSTCHGWIDSNFTVKLYGAADRWILRRFAAVMAVSGDVAQRLLTSGVPREKIHQIRNGIDLRPFLAATPSLATDRRNGALVVGQIARLSHEKGVDIFVRAAALVLREVPETQFLVVGDGPDRVALERLIRELGVASNVVLLGRRTDMPEIYASLDIVVSSSRQEGLSMALLESMASGLPTIATPVGEVSSAIENDVTGILTPIEDKAALAAAMVSLLRDPDRRKRLAAAARRRIESDFSAARMAADYLAIYQSVVKTINEDRNPVHATRDKFDER